MAPDAVPDSNRLDYRSGRDTAADDARAMRRSLRTWTLLTAVWVVGVGVWIVYLVVIGVIVLRLLT
jgi:hypothetical protein